MSGSVEAVKIGSYCKIVLKNYTNSKYDTDKQYIIVTSNICTPIKVNPVQNLFAHYYANKKFDFFEENF